MMDYDLIYRKDALHAVLHNEGQAAVAAVENIKAVDAVPVVHGEWKKGIHIAKCSVCNNDVWFPEDYLEDMDMLDDLHMNYCPNCGAKMYKKEPDHDL